MTLFYKLKIYGNISQLFYVIDRICGVLFDFKKVSGSRLLAIY